MAGEKSSLDNIRERAAEMAIYGDPWSDKATRHATKALAEMIEGLAQEIQLLKEGRTI